MENQDLFTTNESKQKEFIEKTFNYLHAHPEPGFKEFETAKYLAEQLQSFGYKVLEKVGMTGVVGIMDSYKDGPIMAVRSDMDALKFLVNGEEKYYHGCGHDAHMTMVLTVAKLLAQKKIQKGKIYIIFQPAEELGTGAQAMIETGKLNEIKEIVGIHLRPIGEEKYGEASPMLMHNACGVLKIKITGKSSHGARPQEGINAVESAMLAISAVNCMKFNPNIAHSCKVTRVWADGSDDNTVPDLAKVTFDLRSRTNEMMDEMVKKIKHSVTYAAKAIGSSTEFQYIGNPAAEYDPELVSVVKEAITEVLGKSNDFTPCPGGEDFHFFRTMLKAKTAYISLGSDFSPGLHKYGGSFNHDCLIKGVHILEKVVHKRLG